ncbi:unnamed protein product [Penicillium pancosmium]
MVKASWLTRSVQGGFRQSQIRAGRKADIGRINPGVLETPTAAPLGNAVGLFVSSCRESRSNREREGDEWDELEIGRLETGFVPANPEGGVGSTAIQQYAALPLQK